jgi:hypothetical protein
MGSQPEFEFGLLRRLAVMRRMSGKLFVELCSRVGCCVDTVVEFEGSNGCVSFWRENVDVDGLHCSVTYDYFGHKRYQYHSQGDDNHNGHIHNDMTHLLDLSLCRDWIDDVRKETENFDLDQDWQRNRLARLGVSLVEGLHDAPVKVYLKPDAERHASLFLECGDIYPMEFTVIRNDVENDNSLYEIMAAPSVCNFPPLWSNMGDLVRTVCAGVLGIVNG